MPSINHLLVYSIGNCLIGDDPITLSFAATVKPFTDHGYAFILKCVNEKSQTSE